MGFGERLKEIRTENTLNMSEAAELVGVSASTYHNWENGHYPRAEAVRQIASAFGVTAKWLETGLGEKTTEQEQAKAAETQAKKRDESSTVYNREDEEKLRDIETVIKFIKQMDIPKDRKRHIHRTMSAYRTELENIVLFGELR